MGKKPSEYLKEAADKIRKRKEALKAKIEARRANEAKQNKVYVVVPKGSTSGGGVKKGSDIPRTVTKRVKSNPSGKSAPAGKPMGDSIAKSKPKKSMPSVAKKSASAPAPSGGVKKKQPSLKSSVGSPKINKRGG